jgi:hypothetical protein
MGAKWGKNSGIRGQETTSTGVATRAPSLRVKNISKFLVSISVAYGSMFELATGGD